MSTISNSIINNQTDNHDSNGTKNGNTPIDLPIDGDLDEYLEDKDKASRMYTKSVFHSIDNILTRPSYSTAFLNFLCNSTADPVPFLFLLVNQIYDTIITNTKDDLRGAQVRAFDLFITFIHNRSPLSLGVSEDLKGTIWLILQNSHVAFDVVQEIFYEVSGIPKFRRLNFVETCYYFLIITCRVNHISYIQIL